MVLPLPPAKESLHPRTPLGRTGTSSRLTGTAAFSRSNHSATRASLLLLLLLSDLVCDLHLGYNPGAEISSCSGAYSYQAGVSENLVVEGVLRWLQPLPLWPKRRQQ
jgi:hypothetical protein